MRAAEHLPGVLDEMGWNAPTVEPVATLPNGRALHRWPTKYLTPEVHALVRLFGLHREGLPLLDGPVMGWPAWLVDAIGFMGAEQRTFDARQEAAHG